MAVKLAVTAAGVVGGGVEGELDPPAPGGDAATPPQALANISSAAAIAMGKSDLRLDSTRNKQNQGVFCIGPTLENCRGV